MSLCLQPQCLNVNPDNSKLCQKCGAKLLLAERYRAIKKIGEGGFGKTFKAIDEYKPSQPVCVIKQFFPQRQGKSNIEKAAELFSQEAVRLDELGKHPQIPELFAYFSQDGQQYLVQEFIDGQNLLEELEQQGIFNESKICQLLVDILTVLKFVHDNKVIHRDIKPDNIIRRSSDQKLVLVDFGVSKVVTNTSLSVTGTLIGSTQFIAPEQTMGKPKYASDLYSLGITCLYLLTGVQPFDLYDVSEDNWTWRNYLVDNPVSDELGQILAKLSERTIKRRYKTAEEVLAALNLAVTIPPLQPPVSTSPSPQPPRITIPSPQIYLCSTLQIQPPPSTNTANTAELQTFEFETLRITEIDKKDLFGWNKKVTTKAIAKQAQYFRENLGSDVTLDMVYIPGGTFMMGSPEGEGDDIEKPQHQVMVQAFFMSKYPVTQAQWWAISKRSASQHASGSELRVKRELKPNPSNFKGNSLPVEKVSWYDAEEFCRRLSYLTGKKYRLPSEAEWEYACRAGTTTPFYFGKTITSDLAHYDRQQTTPVGQFPPNAFGLYDMHGLVWEWCADTWHDYQDAFTDGSAWTVSVDDRDYRIIRGGSWLDIPYICRSAYRISSNPLVGFNHIGLRVVQELPKNS